MAHAIINGVGCSLVDYLYTDIDFNSARLRPYVSRVPGDGGLVPGELVFAEGLADFAGRDYHAVLQDITAGAAPAASNLGGPSVVALVHAAQLLAGAEARVAFFGVRGDDEVGRDLGAYLARTPLDVNAYHVVPGDSPFTYVLSDPRYADGAGERMFVNGTGVAGAYRVDEVDRALFEAPIVAFGGTGLLPTLHGQLDELVAPAHQKGCLTVVNTVYDFFNQSRDPVGRWPIGNSERTYAATDLLVMDLVEAQRLSGALEPAEAVAFFRAAGVGAVVITRGAEDVVAWAGGGRFEPLPLRSFPISARVRDELRADPARRGDTTGCGDNFVGGLLYSIATQYLAGSSRFDLTEAVAWGVVSGGFSCFMVGGTFFEHTQGQKAALMRPYYRSYCSQIGINSGTNV